MAQRNIGTGSGGHGNATIGFSLVLRGNAFSEQTMAIDTLYNANCPLQVQSEDVADSTEKSVTVPPKAGGVFIILPSGGTFNVNLRIASGGDDFPIGRNGISFFSFNTTPPSTLYFYHTGGSTISIQLIFV